MGALGNKYAAKSKRDLQDIEVRLLNELANLKLDAKRARQRLESARSCMAEVKYDMGQVEEEALRLEAMVQFPAPSITVEVVPQVAQENSKPESYRHDGIVR